KPHTCWEHHAPLTGSMSQTASARTKTRRTLSPNAVGLLAVTAAIVGKLVSSAHLFRKVLRRGHGGTTTATEADGGLPDGVTVFDDQYPGVANLNPDLL